MHVVTGVSGHIACPPRSRRGLLSVRLDRVLTMRTIVGARSCRLRGEVGRLVEVSLVSPTLPMQRITGSVWIDEPHPLMRRGMVSCLIADDVPVAGESASLAPGRAPVGASVLVFDGDRPDVGTLLDVLGALEPHGPRLVATRRAGRRAAGAARARGGQRDPTATDLTPDTAGRRRCARCSTAARACRPTSCPGSSRGPCAPSGPSPGRCRSGSSRCCGCWPRGGHARHRAGPVLQRAHGEERRPRRADQAELPHPGPGRRDRDEGGHHLRAPAPPAPAAQSR